MNCTGSAAVRSVTSTSSLSSFLRVEVCTKTSLMCVPDGRLRRNTSPIRPLDWRFAAVVTTRPGSRNDVDGAALGDAYRSTQSGLYVQGVYQFRPRWRAGLRYDALDSGTTDIGLVTSGALTAADFPALLSGDPARTTLMVDWNPSEFTRLRLQYAWDEARDDGDTDRQLFLQYLYGIGAHGAHKY